MGMCCGNPGVAILGEIDRSPDVVPDTSSVEADSVDTEITDRYAFDGLLGVGTAGRVYLGYDKDDNREPVAIKLIPRRGPKDWRQFYAREVKALQKLKRPRIITLNDYLKDQFSYIVVTEYCAGGSVLDRIHEVEFSERDAADVVIQMIDAVRVCHRKNYVHRDINPTNFLYLNDDIDSNDIVLSGFGLSLEVDDEEVYPNRAGNVFYMAPELAKNDPKFPRTGKVLKACDVWALGVSAYVLMCGSYPFGNQKMTNPEIWEAICTEKVSFPDQIPSLSDSFKNFVSQCLRRNPYDRITINEAREHDWVLGETANPECLSPEEMNYLAAALTSMSKQTNLKKQIVHALTNFNDESSTQTSESLHRQFRLLDKNEDDVLDDKELQFLLESVGYAPSQALVAVQKMLESNDGGSSTKAITFSEFSDQWHRFALQEYDAYAQSVFRFFDGNADGFISKTELGRYLSLSSGQLAGLVKEADTNSDDKISYEEFRTAMREDLEAGAFAMQENTAGLVLDDDELS